MPKTSKKTRIFKGSDGMWRYAKSGAIVELKGPMVISDYSIVKIPAKYKKSMKGGALYKPHSLSGVKSFIPRNAVFPRIRTM